MKFLGRWIFGVLVFGLVSSSSGASYGVGPSGDIYRILTPNSVRLVKDVGISFFDIAQKGGVGYGISSSGSLYRINLRTGSISRRGYSGSGFNALDFRPNGALYAMKNNSTYIYAINPRNGRATRLFNTGFSSDGDIGFRDRNTIYLASGSNKLVRIRLSTRSSVTVGGLGRGDWYGMDYSFQKRQLNLVRRDGRYFRVSPVNGRKILMGTLYPRYRVNGMTH